VDWIGGMLLWWVIVSFSLNQTSGKKQFVFSEIIQPREPWLRRVYLFSQLSVCMLIHKRKLNTIIQTHPCRVYWPLLPTHTLFKLDLKCLVALHSHIYTY